MQDTFEIALGCVLVAFSLACILLLTIWSRNIIEYVAQQDKGTARHLLNELNGND